MHIKRVILEGFKVYKDQITVEFNDKHNCVVGANGAGKSNFFLAIQFVLGDVGLHNLRADERRALLHEGSGNAVLSAYVEIVFDNSDGRLPVERAEVSLRRTIGMKKDEYFLDKKHITKTEVMSLLESAGLSRANPYTIVQQGKVTRLATLTDAQRLDSLMEIAGTRVYDEKREESQRIMRDTDARRSKIEETLGYINDRLDELDAEKKELAEFNGLDRKRRAYECAYHEREVSKARGELEASDARRQQGALACDALRKEEDAAAAQARDVERSLRDAEKAREAARVASADARAQAAVGLEEVARLELLHGQAEADARGASDELERKRAQLDDVRAESDGVSAELAGVEPEFDAAQAAEAAAAAAADGAAAKLAELYKRKAHGSQFKSKKERDAALKKEADALRASLAKREAERAALLREAEGAAQQAAAAQRREHETRDKLAAARAEADEQKAKAAQARRERDEACERRKTLWRREEDARKQAEAAAAELQGAHGRLASAVSRAHWGAIQAVRRLAAQHKIAGVHGMLIELISCDPKFYTAVEVSAANQLFNIVVDDDETAARLVALLRAEGGGRAAFMPLKQLRSGELPRYPETQDAIPLITRLKYERKFEPAVRQVFRKVLVCRNMTVASRLARGEELDCVTLDGDTVSRRGALTGGFHDLSRSRMEAQASVHRLEEKSAGLRADIDAVRAELERVDQEVSVLLGGVQKAEALGTRAAHAADQLALDVRAAAAGARGGGAAEAGEAKKRALAELDEAIAAEKAALDATLQMVKTELATGGLSSREEATLVAEQRREQEAARARDAAHARRAELEAKKVALGARLHDDLSRAAAELEAEIERLTAAADGGAAREHADGLARARRAAAECDGAAAEHERELEKRSEEEQTLKAQLEELRDAAKAAASKQVEEAKQLDRLLTRRNVLSSKLDEHTAAIRTLGSLPRDAMAEIDAGASSRTLLEHVEKINRQLKKFSHVNKKAIDQYKNFFEQRAELLARKEALDEGSAQIGRLIEHLDAEKDLAISRTFKSVSKHFEAVFRELVPGGQGRLVMLTAKRAHRAADAMAVDGEEEDEDDDDDDAEGAGARAASATKYTGVQIQIKFGGGGDTQSIQQLSGGQKTMVALCLIFAIQRCDPAPFYLFDEIDANLDAAHRDAVARMVHRQANAPVGATQFITTTFRPELVQSADKHFGVTARNKMSTITPIQAERALSIIKEEQSVQQQRAA